MSIMKKVITEEDANQLINYLKDKTISVVGNSKSIFTQDYGELIDSADVVMRFNHGIPKEPKHQGKRFDVVWVNNLTTCSGVLDEYLKLNDDFYFVMPGAANGNQHSVLIKGHMYNYKETMKTLGLKKRPSTGMSALRILSTLNCKVNLFGFNPKVGGYNKINPDHDWDGESEVRNRLVDENNHWRIYE